MEIQNVTTYVSTFIISDTRYLDGLDDVNSSIFRVNFHGGFGNNSNGARKAFSFMVCTAMSAIKKASSYPYQH